MTPERYQQISDLFHMARALEAEPRAAFLTHACAGDEELRAQIERLLINHEQVSGVRDLPARAGVAESLAAAARASLIGRRLSHYRVASFIGAGGMGEVYLAEDERLGRKVALKLLPAEFTADPDRVRRFEQEAKAASALNHPNIVTIHEIGKEDARHFIAAEFVEGENLRQRVGRGALPLLEAIDIATQAAGALQAAHAAGIVHRDIKPENIMLRNDGYIKILDFGLAKLIERRDKNVTQVDSLAATVPVRTTPGTILGTFLYMSPEQARGLEVDAPSDLWSLGVVLYEMLIGRAPFQGNTPTDIIVAIVERQPAPLRSLLPAAPAELERIVIKTLAKNCAERYQTAQELGLDLKRLKRRLEYQIETGAALAPESNGGRVSTVARLDATTAVLPPARVSQADEAQPATTSRPGTLRWVWIGLALTLAIAFSLYWLGRDRAIDSIAVMPVQNQGGQPELDYLTDGITESLIDNLSQLSNLKVMSRASVFRYKGVEIDPGEVARTLKVKALLIGRVTQQGDKLIIKLDLIDARDNSQIWGDQYVRPQVDILRLQTEIAQVVSAQLRRRLTGAEKERVARNYTENPEAYELYLKGLFHWNKLTREGLEESIKYFNEAVAKDSTYALAYAWLSAAYYTLGANYPPQQEMRPKAKANALIAQGLDDTLAEAHAALAMVYYGFEWNWAATERELQLALELNPNHGRAYGVYGYLLQTLERAEEAIPMTKRALELDPLSMIANLNMGRTYYLAGHYDQALAAYGETLKLEPKRDSPHLFIGRLYALRGEHEKAIAIVSHAQPLAVDDKRALAFLGYVKALAGKRAEAQQILEQLNQHFIDRTETKWLVAGIYTALGQPDQAFLWLEKVYQDRNLWIINSKLEPMFKPLRTDPRFKDLLRRTGQPQ